MGKYNCSQAPKFFKAVFPGASGENENNWSPGIKMHEKMANLIK